MADIRAFRGFRYDLGRVGALSDVVCPPYDVIGPDLYTRLCGTSPFNAVRLELPEPRPEDAHPDDRYARAAATLRDWLAEGILRQDTARGLYVYEQQFTLDGTTYTRRGFFARVRLEPFGAGRIYPHERTLSGPKEDRLKLYRATGFNLSPVFGLYPDEAGEVAAVLEPFTHQAPPLVATDHLGVVNRLWLVTDTHAVSTVTGLMGPKPVYIADGHHRYETGLRYLEERRAAGDVPDDEAPAHFTLMVLVGMSDPGLVILPTHRLLGGLGPVGTRQLEEVLAPHFAVVERSGTDPKAAWDYLQLDGDQTTLAFGTAADREWFVARLRDPGVMAELAPDHSPDWRTLAVSILHRLVIDRLLTPAFGAPTCRYVHLLSEAAAAAADRHCDLAVLVPPVTIDHITRVAGHGEPLPPKSTYFYPKLLTGLVFNSLKQH